MTPDSLFREQSGETPALRAHLREARLAARMAMTADEHAQASTQIERNLATLLDERPAQSIAFCWPIRDEFDCRPLITRLLAQGWQAAQPVVATPRQPMEFRRWAPGTPMIEDRHGIPIPLGPRVAAPAIVLLPLVAFDLTGYRLGYGGGYFDRTLAVLDPPPLAIGVGFELACVASIHPQPHDMRLDIIVTETAVRVMD